MLHQVLNIAVTALRNPGCRLQGRRHGRVGRVPEEYSPAILTAYDEHVVVRGGRCLFRWEKECGVEWLFLDNCAALRC